MSQAFPEYPYKSFTLVHLILAAATDILHINNQAEWRGMVRDVVTTEKTSDISDNKRMF